MTSDDRYASLVESRAAGLTLAQAASAAGMTTGAAKSLWGRRTGSTAWPMGDRYRIADATRQAMDDLAEAMAEGAPSVSAAARTLRLTQSRADQLWQRVRAELGPQAA